MPTSINKTLEVASIPGTEPVGAVLTSSTSARRFEKDSSSALPEVSLSANEQRLALSERYAEAGLKVSVNFQTVDGHLVYIVKDSDSGDVIRQIPSAEAQRISKHLDRLTGIMLDKSVE